MVKKGNIVSCKVKKINKTFLLVELFDKQKAIVHISNISDYYVGSLKNLFKLDGYYDFEVIDSKIDNIKLSWKSLNPRFLKNPVAFEIKETKKGFNNLKKFVMEEIEND